MWLVLASLNCKAMLVAGEFERYLQDDDIDAVDQPTRFPDLNALEDTWDTVYHGSHKLIRLLHSQGVQVSKKVPQEAVRHLIRKMQFIWRYEGVRSYSRKQLSLILTCFRDNNKVWIGFPLVFLNLELHGLRLLIN